eukprot:266482-Rhodomonas_salina.1
MVCAREHDTRREQVVCKLRTPCVHPENTCEPEENTVCTASRTHAGRTYRCKPPTLLFPESSAPASSLSSVSAPSAPSIASSFASPSF